MLIPFVGPSYVYPTTNFDNQRAINIYPTKSETGNSKAAYIMLPTPGKKVFSTLPAQSIRGQLSTSTQAFVVAYNILYEVLADGTYNALGTLDTYSGNVSMAYNGIQVIVVDGTPTGGWIYNVNTGVYEQIIAMGFEGGTTVIFVGGYFAINRPDTGIWQVSALYDGTMWDATQFANAEGSPDNLVALVELHLQVYLLGGDSLEVDYNSGEIFPFNRVQGVFIEYGCNAPFSVQQCANTIFWLGSDTSGANVVWTTANYQPQKISTEAIEYYLSQYDVSGATSYSYQEQGHYFYVLNIPGAPTSLVYDTGMGQWHERAFWNSSAGRYERDRANFHMYVFGKHLVSDYENGNIYEQSLSILDDNSGIIRRTRILPYFTDDLEFLYFKSFQLDMLTGIGLESGAIEDTNPMVILKWSDDGGHNWSTEHTVPIGKIGEFQARALWRRLGRSRARIFEVSVVSRIPVYMIAAHIDVEKGNA